MKMISTSECIECENGSISNNNSQKVHCSLKNKEYFYGQKIPCENKKKKIGENNE